MDKRIIGIFIGILYILTSCVLPSNRSISAQGTREPLIEEGEYNIYYLDSDMKSLKPIRYKASAVEQSVLIKELLEQIMKLPMQEGIRPVLEENIVYKEMSVSDKILYLYFNEEYSNMKFDQQILAMGAFAKTLTQIEGIEYIDIFAGEKQLMDSKGKALGPVSGKQFFDSVSDVNAYKKANIVLYFADKSGEKLVKEERELFYYINTSLDKIIIDELIIGPENPELQRVLPNATKLISSSIVDGICYVNFNQEFLQAMQGQKESITIDALVQSLTEMQEIQKVQISVEGSKNYMYRDIISLNTFFERITKE